MPTAAYGIGKLVQRPFEETVASVRRALKEQGFGVLCEIDVQATMKEKLGVEGDKYVILGACNPPLAHRALTAEREIGLLLPCNVIVYESEGGAKVSAIDPELMLGFVGNPELSDVAVEVGERLRSVIENV
jgi:uncharacterized protein (DUF302 family)